MHLLFFIRFRRRVMLPKGVDPDSVTSTMTPDGIITITAPKMALMEGKQSPCYVLTQFFNFLFAYFLHKVLMSDWFPS